MHPRFSELLVGPFVRPEIYPRAASLPPLRTFLALALVTACCGLLLAGGWYLPRSHDLAKVEGTELEQLPSITIDSEGVHCRHAGPEAFDAGLFVVWLELDSTRPSPEAVHELLNADEKRPIVHISGGALVVYKRGESPRPLPWTDLLEREGRISVSGDSVQDWLAEQLRHRAVDAWMLGVTAVLLAQFVLLLVFVLLHRLLFRGPNSSLVRPLATAGAIAAIPPTVLATLLGLVGLSQAAMLGTYLLAFGLTFLFMSGRLQIGDELGRPSPSDDSPTDMLGGLDADQVEQMKAQGLLGAEDYAVAMDLLRDAGGAPTIEGEETEE